MSGFLSLAVLKSQTIGRLICFLVLCLLVVPTTARSQEKKPKNYKIVLTMNKNKVRSLLTDGYIKAPIPASYQNRITAIVLKHEDNVLEKRLKMDGKATKLGRNLILPLTEAVVERLKYQPLELKVYSKGYSSVVLKFEGELRTPIRQPLARPINIRPRQPINDQSNTASSGGSGSSSTASGTRPPVPSSVGQPLPPAPVEPKIKLPVNEVDPRDYRYIRVSADKGTDVVVDLRSLPLKTEFGQVAVDLNTVDGILFNVDGEGKMVIQLRNGDLIKGTTDLKEVPVYSRWGNESLKIEEIHSITPSRLQRFQKEEATDEGQLDRWFIKY